MSIVFLAPSSKVVLWVHCCGGWLHECRLHDQLAAVIATSIYDAKERQQLMTYMHARVFKASFSANKI